MTSELPRILTKEELLQMVPYTPQHILRLEKAHQFPQRIKIGTRRVGWYFSEVQEWLSTRPRQPCAPVIPPAAK